jgi:hypothetical protein
MKINSFEDLKELFNFDPIELLDEVFKKSSVQDKMIEFNQDQLQQGQDALGQAIVTIGGSPYRPFTVAIKKAKGQPTNKVTLEDTGDFYKTFKVIIHKDEYEIIANFEKQDGSILDNFSSNFDFLGLDKESITELANEIIYPRLGQLINKRLGF